MPTEHARTRPKDATRDLLRDGYTWADAARARAADPAARALPVRLLGRPALLVRGAEAVRFFYDGTLLRREGAVPLAVRLPLFGRGAVHGLDDGPHHRRKELFLRATEPRRRAGLVAAADAGWARAVAAGGPLDVHATAVRVHGRAVQRWAGIELPEAELDRRAAGLAQVVDGFGVPGPAWVQALRARRESESWALELIGRTRLDAVRAGRAPDELSVLELVAGHRGEDGQLLPGHTAAVELLNLLRPTVAVSWFAAFAALALHEHPGWARRLREEAAGRATAVGGPEATAFAHEVRRLFPFVPLLAARARRPLEWGGHRLEAGQRVVLDVHGTNTDPWEWERAGEFDPARFLGTGAGAAANLVPQGGGDVAAGHRCPGEDVTVAVLAVAAAHLASRDWRTDPAGLRYDLHRMPTRPQGGPVLEPLA
ncbi:cytochrome P450 [Kocuria sp. LUK]|uniref:cytochrome P450 n=1 Tax=Kocuria sp. LUK TaxID=2897828 RepID=UPI001E579652|nr:cytochrome P450 [Kocuria sp. LUK]MCD1143936.1 cytochrome P450 [Kocuria sp. LUK]